MRVVPLVKIVNKPVKLLTPAARRRMRKIASFVSEHPLCSLSDLYKEANVTKNREDIHNDIEYMVLTGDLKQISVSKRFFKEPVKNGFQNIVSFYQQLDEIVSICKHSPSLQKSEFAKQIRENWLDINEFNLGRILKTYKQNIEWEKHLGDQFLSKLWIDFIQKTKIISSEAKRIDEYHDEVKKRLDNNYKEQMSLIQNEKILLEKESSASKRKKIFHKRKRREIREERELRKLIHDTDWKQFKLQSERTTASINHLNLFVDLFKSFLKDYEFWSRKLISSPVIVQRLSDALNQVFEDDRQYAATLRSVRRKPLKERIKIWSRLLTEEDHKQIVQEYGYKSKKALLKLTELIQDDSGQPDIEKMMNLQRIEKNRILVPETRSDEILSLFYKYKIKNGFEKVLNGSRRHQAKKLMQENRATLLSI